MDAAFRYLKWNDDVVGLVVPDLSVRFAEPRFNTTVGLYTHGQTSWTPDQFLQFLSERIMSPARRDIERLLFRCGLSEYDVFKIADATRAINPRDELWLASTPDASMAEAATEVFDAIFLQRTDAAGDSVDTPEGANVKRYGASPGRLRHREAAHQPAFHRRRVGGGCVPVGRDAGHALLPRVALRRRRGVQRIRVRLHLRVPGAHAPFVRWPARRERAGEPCWPCAPKYADDLYRMIAFDFITRQDDRHLSNIAVLVTEGGEVFYPLYDNGRSLFYEDTESFARKAAADPRAFATTFGYVGTYWDHARDIAAKGVRFGDLLNLDVDERTVRQLLVEAGFTDYRLEAATEWIANAVECLKSLG